MKYFVDCKDRETKERHTDILEEQGYRVVEDPEDALIISMGGDGTILYNARRTDNPRILPVSLREGSEGKKIQVYKEELLEAVEKVENGDYRIDEVDRISAFSDTEINGDFKAMSEIQLHHISGRFAARFDAEVFDGSGSMIYSRENVIADGAIVATPFGSSGYYRTAVGETFEEGLGLAFNNVHSPREIKNPVRLPLEGRVRLRCLRSDRSELIRDNDSESYRLESDEVVEVGRVNAPVELVKVDL